MDRILEVLKAVLILEELEIVPVEQEIFLVLEIPEQVIMLKVVLMLVLIDKENLEHNN